MYDICQFAEIVFSCIRLVLAISSRRRQTSLDGLITPTTLTWHTAHITHDISSATHSTAVSRDQLKQLIFKTWWLQCSTGQLSAVQYAIFIRTSSCVIVPNILCWKVFFHHCPVTDLLHSVVTHQRHWMDVVKGKNCNCSSYCTALQEALGNYTVGIGSV